MSEEPEKLMFSGIWWSPVEPERVVHGTLTIEPYKKSSLKVTDIGKTGALHLDLDRENVILVGTAEGRDFTLIDINRAQRPRVIEELTSTITYEIGTVFLDVHWLSREAISFNQIRIQFHGLTSWSRFEPLSWPTNQPEFIALTPKQINSLYKDDTVSIDLINQTMCSKAGSSTEFCYKKISTIVFQSDTECSFDTLIPFIEQIQYFLSLCLGIAVYPETIEGGTSAVTEPSFTTQEPIYLAIPIITIRFRRYNADLLPAQANYFCPIAFEDLKDESQIVLGRWLEQHATFNVPRMLFFGTIYGSQISVENKFITRVQCIEVYHRISEKYNQTLHDPEEYKQDLNKVKRALKGTDIQKKRQEEFIGKLKRGNQPPLENRINKILQRHEDVAPLITGPFQNFAKAVVDNRNFLTHYDPKGIFTPALPSELSDISRRLGCLFYVCMLDELGVGTELKQKVIQEMTEWNLPR
jgi:hypothetical protein